MSEMNLNELTSFVAATPAQATRGLDPTASPAVPTCPVSFLEWSDDNNLNGWSARTFLHQLLIGSMPHWRPLDTERLLSEWTPLRLRGNPASATSLSDAIRPATKVSAGCFRSAKMVRGVIRRASARGRSLRVLLRTEHATTAVIVTFGTKASDCASWMVQSERHFPACLTDGLLDFLRRHAPECSVTASSRIAPNTSGG